MTTSRSFFSISAVYMLQGDLDPHVYYQPNLRAYDGTHSLLGDLLDLAFAKYRRYSTLPIKSLRLKDIGSGMADTMGVNWSGVTGAILNGTSAQFTTPNKVCFNAASATQRRSATPDAASPASTCARADRSPFHFNK